MKRYILLAIIFLLMLLYGWTALSNFRDLQAFNIKLHLQVFPPLMADVLTFTIPPLLAVVFFLLFIPESRVWGLAFSTVLLTLFSAYSVLILCKFFEGDACSCISIFKGMNWTEQTVVNLVFLTLSIIGLTLKRKEAQ